MERIINEIVGTLQEGFRYGYSLDERHRANVGVVSSLFYTPLGASYC